MTEYSIVFAPLIAWPWLVLLAALAAIPLGWAFYKRARGAVWRLGAVAGLLLALANPMAVIEERRGLADIGLVVIDESDSAKIGQRSARIERAAEALRDRLSREKDFDLRIVRAGASAGLAQDGTRLFEAIERALSDVPRNRLAGVALLTDGQVHDAPAGDAAALARLNLPGPIHALLAGERNEADRRLVLEQAPGFAIVAKPQTLTIRVDDGAPARPNAPRTLARVAIKRDGVPFQTIQVPVGVSTTVDFQLDKAGQTVFELEVEAGPRELTLDNNRQTVVVNGVRDRLRVLLVTGEPHAGERTWRNLLKSDPAVDLVHFTILRPPESQDFTPVNELSLIAFPIRELFEVKLAEFDLVIFDRYRRRDVLAPVYLDNIVRYVRGGGALLISVGSNFSAPNSLFNSPIGAIMPGAPTGQNFESAYRPGLSDMGRRHPVTADLPGAGAAGAQPEWGRWFRHIDTEPRRGQMLMTGAQSRPLLLLDRVGEGRVAQLMSDHIWLWARGLDGGGPHAELLRRIAHWLMKEPELEENDLKVRVRGNRVEIERRSLEPVQTPVTVTAPDGTTQSVTLSDTRTGRQAGFLTPDRPGLYRLNDGERTALAAVGAVNPRETADVRTTDALLKPAVENTGGSVQWLVDGVPEVRRVRPGRDMGGPIPGGRGWIGFRANGEYVVTGVAQTPLMPGLLTFLACLALLLIAWRREGR
jgi:hypothetical protein